MKKKLKKLFAEIILAVLPVLIIIILILSAVSGAYAIKDKLSNFFNGGKNSSGKTVADYNSEEEFLLDLLEEKDGEEDFLDNSFFEEAHMTKGDFKKMLEAIIDSNSSIEQASQDVKYEYKSKARDKVEKKTVTGSSLVDENGSSMVPQVTTTMVWGSWSEEATRTATVNISSASIESGYKVYWQDMFALYQLVAKENMPEWMLKHEAEETLQPSSAPAENKEKSKDDDEYVLSDVMSEEEIQKVIQSVAYSYEYYYDGARGDNDITLEEFDTVCYYEASASIFNTTNHEEKGTVRVPISVPVQIGNAIESIVAQVDPETHKLLGYKRCINPDGMEYMLSDILDEFQWDLFLEILSALPGSEQRVTYYEEIRARSESGGSIETTLLSIEEVLGEGCPTDIYIGTNCIVTAANEETGGGYGAIYGDWDLSGEGDQDMTLAMKDNITAEQMNDLIAAIYGASSYTSTPSALLGTGDAFVKAQEDYGVSAIGMLAIACHESAYGTSKIAREKNNFFGWGAIDSDPYNGAWSFGANDAAVYTVVKKIAQNYTYGTYKQDTYHKMRFNNGTHQYCTDTNWPNACANMRAKLMKLAVQMGFGSGTGGYVSDVGDGDAYEKIDSLPSVSASSMQALVSEALSYVGTAEYELGMTGQVSKVSGKKQFDCSGLVYYLYRNHFSMTIPRTSASQSEHGVTVSVNDLQPGDLIFTPGTYSSGVHHVQVYVGNGTTVSASGENIGIRSVPVTNIKNIVTCKRYVNIE